MATETAGSSGARRPRRRVHAWVRLFAVAAALLLVSEAVWVWQTWPVRELLQMPVPGSPGVTR